MFHAAGMASRSRGGGVMCVGGRADGRGMEIGKQLLMLQSCALPSVGDACMSYEEEHTCSNC